MIAGQINTLTGSALIGAKLKAFSEMLKFRLSLLVAFSCTFGFVLASRNIEWPQLLMLFLGAFLLSGASIN